MTLTKSMLVAYKTRWEEVADFESSELQEISPAERWRQLNSLIRIGALFDALEDERDVQFVRERWNELKERYLRKAE